MMLFYRILLSPVCMILVLPLHQMAVREGLIHLLRLEVTAQHSRIQTLQYREELEGINLLMSFLEELAKKGVIKESQIGEIKSRATEKYNGDIDEALLESGVSGEKILEVKGEYLTMPIKKINAGQTSFDALKYIYEDSAMHYHFVPIELHDG